MGGGGCGVELCGVSIFAGVDLRRGRASGGRVIGAALVAASVAGHFGIVGANWFGRERVELVTN